MIVIETIMTGRYRLVHYHEDRELHSNVNLQSNCNKLSIQWVPSIYDIRNIIKSENTSATVSTNIIIVLFTLISIKYA